MKKHCLVGLAAFVLFSHTGWAAVASLPSFDCATARPGNEQAICNDSDLSALDMDLAARYEKLMSNLPFDQKDPIRQAQRDWLRKRDKECVGTSNDFQCLRDSWCAASSAYVHCLVTAYSKRADELNALARAWWAKPIHTLPSPDRSLEAVVKTNSHSAYSESELEIRQTGGKSLQQLSFIGPDEKHGAYVSQAEWTSNSQFFVFRTINSAGHHAWETPIQVYDRKDNKIADLDTGIDFKLKGDDEIKIRYMEKPSVTVHLSQIVEHH